MHSSLRIFLLSHSPTPSLWYSPVSQSLLPTIHLPTTADNLVLTILCSLALFHTSSLLHCSVLSCVFHVHRFPFFSSHSLKHHSEHAVSAPHLLTRCFFFPQAFIIFFWLRHARFSTFSTTTLHIISPQFAFVSFPALNFLPLFHSRPLSPIFVFHSPLVVLCLSVCPATRLLSLSCSPCSLSSIFLCGLLLWVSLSNVPHLSTTAIPPFSMRRSSLSAWNVCLDTGAT